MRLNLYVSINIIKVKEVIDLKKYFQINKFFSSMQN